MPRILIPLRHILGVLQYTLGIMGRRIKDEMWLDVAGLHTAEEMAEDGFGAYWLGSERAPEKVTATDLFYLRSIDREAANVPYLLAQYFFRHTEGRKSGAMLSGGYFIGRLAHHFGLVNDDGLRGLSVVAHNIECTAE
ncbi:hypothetical protein Tco_0242083 [Tanacetum coccineum]